MDLMVSPAGLVPVLVAGWHDGNLSGWELLFVPLFIGARLALLAGAVWLGLRLWRRRDRVGMNRARSILNERYARGEISTEDYWERVSGLR